MNTKTLAAGLILLVGCLAASSAAIYYKLESMDFRDKWERAQAQLHAQPSLPETIAPSIPAMTVPLAAPTAATPTPDLATNDAAETAGRIQALETALAEKDRAIQALQQARPTADGTSTNRSRNRFNPTAWMEGLKETDPDRYKQIQDARAEAQRRVDDAFAKKSAHLLQRDTAALAEDEKAAYNQMVQLLSETWTLSEKLRSDLPREERREAWQMLREKTSALEPLLLAERQREFQELAATVGYSENDAPQFVKYLNDVIEITTLQNISGFGSRRGGGPGGSSGPTNSQNRATAPVR